MTSAQRRQQLRPMTDVEWAMALAAAGIRFPRGCGEGQITVTRLATLARQDGRGQITDGQGAALRAIVLRYRRQLAADIVALAGTAS